MTSDLYLGIDQGSSSTKGILLDHSGVAMAEWSAPVPEQRYDGRCVEQDPEGLLNSVVEIFLKARQFAQQRQQTITAFGLAVQRSGVLAWREGDGIPVHPVITWADTRTYPIIQGFGRGAELISTQTGLPTIANFAAPKIHLLQRQFLEPSILVGTLDSFLVHRLSGRKAFITEDTMASRTMLYALSERNWSDGLCRQFQVDRRRLARINPSLAPHASFEGVPLMALLGDQQAALLGCAQTARRPLLNLGTIAALTVNTGSEIVQKPALKTSVLYSRLIPNAATREYLFLIESTSPVTGTVSLEPLRRAWCQNTTELQRLCDEAYTTDPAGLATAYFVNHQDPSPVWPKGIPNVMVCKPGASIADRARAVVENVGNLIARMIEEFSEKGLLGQTFPAQIDVAGGGSELEYLMQYIADITGHTLRKRRAKEAGARGAAIAAWMSACSRSDSGDLSNESPEKVYVCQNPDRRRRYLLWQRMESDVLKNSLPPHAEIEEAD